MKKAVILILLSAFYYQFVSAQAGWTQKANFGLGAVTEARAFSIGNFGYVGGPTANLWRYDAANDVWAQMAAFPGPLRSSPVAFAIGNKGYLGTGGSNNDFWEYDPAVNAWTAKANFGGSGREGAVGIAVNGKGYIGTGGNYLNDWWEYDTTSNAWTQKANLAGPGRYHAGAFAVNGKGYVCTGFNGAFYNDLWEFDPVNNTWVQKTSMPGTTRDRPVGIGTFSKGYILTGWTGGAALNDAYEYDPVADAWTTLTVMPTAGRYNACGIAINNNLYLGTGIINGTGSDWWEYSSGCSVLATGSTTSCPGTCDGTAFVTFPNDSAITSYQWSGGQTTAIAQNLCAGTYVVTVTDTTGCTSLTSVIVMDAPPMQSTLTLTTPDCFGDTSGGVCIAVSGNPLAASYLWSTGDTTQCISGIAAGSYTVTVTDSTGCSTSIPAILTQPGQINLNFNVVNASCASCANGTAAAQLLGGTPPATYLWSTGSTLAFISNMLPGFYSCCVTDANGCSACDTVEITYTIGLEDLITEELKIFPNPFADKINLVTNNFTEVNVRMMDLSGREVLIYPVRTGKNIVIHTETLNTGMYFIEIIGTEKRTYYKLLKQ